MGTKYLFKCIKCNYEVESSGKRDIGMMAVVKPYICRNCNELTDVQIGIMGEDILKEQLNEEQKDFYKCWECNSENIIEWDTKQKPCPKCGSKMVKKFDEPTIMWD